MLRIITDSSSEIEQEEAKALGIEVIPLTVVFGDRAYYEGIDLKKDEFFKRLAGGEFPHTSQPSTEQFLDAFARTNGEETLVILISSALSGTVNAAELAKREGNFTRVHIYDSLCTTAMMRILVETAVANRERSAEEAIARLNEVRSRIRLHAFVDTLEYLRKGGRIKRSAAIVGGLLGIKPLITVSVEGTVVMEGKERGQRHALKALAEKFESDRPDEAYPVYFLRSDGEAPSQELQRLLHREKDPILQICCAVGTHIGPNAAGVVYVSKK